MAARAGEPQGSPVSLLLVRQPCSGHHLKLAFLAVAISHDQKAIIMTQHIFTLNDIFRTTPWYPLVYGELRSEKHDYVDFAQTLEVLSDLLIDTKNSAERPVVCRAIGAYLHALEKQLQAPLSAAHQEALTTDSLPPLPDAPFAPDEELLREYCVALNTLLLDNRLEESIAKTLTGLLYELLGYLVEELTTPCFLRGDEQAH